MRKYCVCCACLFAVLLWLSVGAANADTREVRIVVFGDSLTSGFQIGKEAGYADQLKIRLEKSGYRNFVIMDMSETGETTSASYQRVNKVIYRAPDIVIVALGMDDAARGVRVDFINQYVGLCISALKQQNIGVMVLGVNAPAGASPQYAGQLSAMYDKLANHYKAAYYPGVLDEVIARPDLSLADRYRPNSKGVAVMVDNTYRMVGQYINNVQAQRNWLESNPGEAGAPLPPMQDVPAFR